MKKSPVHFIEPVITLFDLLFEMSAGYYDTAVRCISGR